MAYYIYQNRKCDNSSTLKICRVSVSFLLVLIIWGTIYDIRVCVMVRIWEVKYDKYSYVTLLICYFSLILYILKNPIMNFELHRIGGDANKCADLIAHRTHFTSFNLAMMNFSFLLLTFLFVKILLRWLPQFIYFWISPPI
jgi:hypothetical protein